MSHFRLLWLFADVLLNRPFLTTYRNVKNHNHIQKPPTEQVWNPWEPPHTVWSQQWPASTQGNICEPTTWFEPQNISCWSVSHKCQICHFHQLVAWPSINDSDWSKETFVFKLSSPCYPKVKKSQRCVCAIRAPPTTLDHCGFSVWPTRTSWMLRTGLFSRRISMVSDTAEGRSNGW